ncbi:hypothetical protein Q760_03800 [Cellulomonas cellasea DSM 20118]|uniref:Uncharacterized protein n=1 Tax=Cellulomonas cellasea DSM 20118 TaxID=1408250 RepID=A0A0A0B4L9_9CELL|nr:hypothetical protein Q760_03800 [Cellulomonas cellasea DSM 20118]
MASSTWAVCSANQSSGSFERHGMRPATIWSNCWLFSSVVMTGLGGHGPDPPWFTVSSSVVSRTMSS